MKRAGIVLISTFILLTGCSKGLPKPEDTVNEFFTEYKELNFDGMKSKLSSELTNTIDSKLDERNNDTLAYNVNYLLVGDIKSENDENNNDTSDVEINKLSDLAGSIKYRIVNTNYNEDKTKAELTLKISHIDAGEEIIHTFGEFFDKLSVIAFSEPQLSEFEMREVLLKILNESMSKYKTKTTNSKGVIELSKEESDNWVISGIDKGVVNSIAFDVPNTIERLDSQLIVNSGKGFYESLRELEEHIYIVKVETSLRNIHRKVQSIINQKKFISYDDFIEEHPVIISNGIKDLAHKEIVLSNEVGTAEEVFYVTRGKGMSEIVVSITTNNKTFSFNGREN